MPDIRFQRELIRTVEVPADPSGDIRIGETVGLETVVDAEGNVLAGRPYRPNTSQAAAQELTSEFTCVNNATEEDFFAFEPWEIFDDSARGVMQYLYHPYLQQNARQVGAAWTKQWEICSTGGADRKDGWRIIQTGAGQSIPDAEQTYRIGWEWQTGSTPANYSISLGFQVAPPKSPVSISGSVNQQPQDWLKGSFNGPFPSTMDLFARNAANAWWEDSCVDSLLSPCFFNGSSDFQGTVAHALWEFPQSSAEPGQFVLAAYSNDSCSNFVLVCPTDDFDPDGCNNSFHANLIEGSIHWDLEDECVLSELSPCPVEPGNSNTPGDWALNQIERWRECILEEANLMPQGR